MSLGKRVLRGVGVLALLAVLSLLVQWFGGTYGGIENGFGDTGSFSGYCRLKVTYPYDSDKSDIRDLAEVEAAVNEIVMPEMGIIVEFLPVEVGGAYDDYMLWLSRGDVIDLMYLEQQNIHPFIDAGFLRYLNVLLQREAPYIDLKDRLADGDLSACAVQQGRIYGVSGAGSRERVEGYGLWVSQLDLERAGLVYQPEHIYTLDEIEGVLAVLKDYYPDSYPLGQLTYQSLQTTSRYYTFPGNPLGDEYLTGVVAEDADVVVNVFATAQYREFLRCMRRWQQAEYLYPEGATYANDTASLLRDGTILMLPGESRPGYMEELLGEAGDYVCLQTVAARKRGKTSADGFWCVPATGAYPEAAVEFLNALYADERLANLFNYGIEGKHYGLAEGGSPVIKRLEDGFYNPWFSFGDCGRGYTLCPASVAEWERLYGEAASDRDSRYDGFDFDTSEVSMQMAQCRRVAEKYTYLLESGSVDVERSYADFLSELTEAGMEEILAEKQRQLDVWLARQGEDG